MGATDDKGMESAGRIEEGLRLARFYTKTLGEALHLGADRVTVRLSQDDLLLRIFRGEAELKSAALTPSWLTSLYDWLAARCHPVLSDPLRSILPRRKRHS